MQCREYLTVRLFNKAACQMDNCICIPKAPACCYKMILARLLEKITVDRDYNIELHFYVTVEDFDGIAASAS